ncbi:MAG: adenosine deaminase [Microbacteriaceae bacterium]|nr:adenosine deaminase [Microbacteriaceae bacterium]
MAFSEAELRPLPKISLHDHLDGGLKPSTIIELADEIGYELPANTPESLGNWFFESCQSGNLVDYLKTFDVTLAVMQTKKGLKQVAKDFVYNLAADGVIWGEVRWAPEQHQQQGLELDQIVEAVQSGIDEAIDELEGKGVTIGVGQLVSAMRQNNNAYEMAELALRHRDRGVVGFDIAGPEAGFLPKLHRHAFTLLAKEHFPVTVHAGEADGIKSINSALLHGRALRLGHGVRIMEDIKVEKGADVLSAELGRTAAWVRDRGITLECSPTSNIQTGAFSQWGSTMAEHPINLLYDLGFNVTINTDNRLMSNTTLSREMALLSEAFDYDLEDFANFQLNAASSAFVSLDVREELISTITDAYFGV